MRNVIEGDARKQVEARKDELKEHKKHDKNYSGVLPSDEVMMEEAKRVMSYRQFSYFIDINSYLFPFGTGCFSFAYY